MKIIDTINAKRIERQLLNGLTEVKEFYDSGQLKYHCFLDKNGKKQEECKWYRDSGKLFIHRLYKNGELIKDYLA